jgi:hypothetical protein
LKRTLIPALTLLAGLSAHAQYSPWLPNEQQFVVTPGFVFSTFDKFWLGEKKIDNPPNGKSLDQYITFLSLEYGILPDLAADATVGYTWTDTKAFGATGTRDDRGLADTYLGLRYRIWDEHKHEGCWFPSIAVRVGGIIPGTYDENFPFSAGDGAAGVESSLLLAREICPGFGVFGDIGYRVRDAIPDDVFGSAGFYVGYKGVTATFAYRHVQGLSGPDIGDAGFGTRFGFPDVKEINQTLEFGLGYTDSGERHYQVFYARTIDGRNTGEKNIIGVSASFLFGGK